MRIWLILVLSFSIISCEKSFESLGGEVYLETTQASYTVGDSVLIYLINDSNRPVFSHPPGGWVLNKKIGDEWKAIGYNLLGIVLPPLELKNRRTLVYTSTLQDTGLYNFQFYLSWDRDAKYLDKLGWIFSNTFQIMHGT